MLCLNLSVVTFHVLFNHTQYLTFISGIQVLDPQGASSPEWQRAIEMLEALVLEGPPSDMVYVPPVLTIDYHSIPEGPRTQNSHQGKAPQGNRPHQGEVSAGPDGRQNMPPRPPTTTETPGRIPQSKQRLPLQGGNGSTATQPQAQQSKGNQARTVDPDSVASNDPHRDQQGRGRGRGSGSGRGRGDLHNHSQQQQQQNGEKPVSNGNSGRNEMNRGSGRGRG